MSIADELKPTLEVTRSVALALALSLPACGGGSSPTPLPSANPGCTMTERAVANEGWMHVAEGSSVAYAANPPASGPHYPVWLRYEAYSTPQARPYWVHNLEHGAIVLLHRPDAQAAGVTALNETFRALPNDPACGHARALLTTDPALPTPFAALAANFVLQGDCVDPQAIARFTSAHRNQAPEDVCASGTRP